jgi:hypothetical protein
MMVLLAGALLAGWEAARALNVIIDAVPPTVGGTITIQNISAGGTVSDTATAILTGVTSGNVVRASAVAQPGFRFIRWQGNRPAGTPLATSPITWTCTSNELFEALFLNNTIDDDGDGLFDIWEWTWGLNFTNNPALDLANGNTDADFLPDAGFSQYPIPIGSAVWNQYGYGPNPNNPFNNLREQSGFDLIFNGLVPPAVRGDDPRTDPKDNDTDNDGLPDGWEYYFWGSAATLELAVPGSTIGMRNGPGGGTPILCTVVMASLDPIVGGGDDDDPDNDGLTNAQELTLRTDPIHWDSDLDGLPDGWEVTRGLDPRDPEDADDNPDGDFYATDGAGNNHEQVYNLYGFDPRTAWGAEYWNIWSWAPGNPTGGDAGTPNTAPFTNLREYELVIHRGTVQGFDPYNPARWDRHTTNPNNRDTDGDGIHDGWELYMSLNPWNQGGVNDANQNFDADGLTNLQEFQCQQLGNLADAGWLNKIWPTDIRNPDTDGDQIIDGDEAQINRYAGGSWQFNCYTGGALNPTSVDTDGDHIPDAWEARYSVATLASATGAMNGTVQDDKADYDGDGLLNYQEYMTASVGHWQYEWMLGGWGNNPWVPGLPLGSYNPFDYFTLQPQPWDWHYYADTLWDNSTAGRRADAYIPYYFIDGIQNQRPTGIWFSSTDPTDWDSSGNNVDDFYCVFHGLNPLFGTYDLYSSKFFGVFVIAALPPTVDIRVYPYISGSPYLDPDQDGLPNSEESLQPNWTPPEYYHTDPSPLWITDISYDRSWANLYFQPQQPGYMIASFAPDFVWFWSDPVMRGANPPDYMYSFECTDGFDTDNDVIGDRAELNDTTAGPGYTDPQDADSPRRRRAMYLDGNSAARTFGQFYHSAFMLNEFTVEAWINPQNPASGVRQVILERPVVIPNGNVMGFPEGIRLNFRLGLTADGRPFCEYTGLGYDLLYTTEAPAAYVLAPNEWYHLAGAYDAVTRQLMVFINGNLVASKTYAERPCNGWVVGNPGFAFFAPLVVGARDNNPDGIPNGQFNMTGDAFQFMAGFAQPSLAEYFRGWVDEVRVWDGVCTPGQIATNMTRTLHLADVAASLADRNANVENALLISLYGFDNLTDAALEGIEPLGFSLLNGRPNDGSYPGVPWWRTAIDRSTVYNNYHYIPWIANLAARYPINPPADTRYQVHSATNDYANNANPYNFGFLTALTQGGEQHPYYINRTIIPFSQAPTALFNDLLPMRNARIDASIPLWDGAGGGYGGNYDSNGDGIPDWWAQKYGYDPYGDSIAHLDPDNDGLSNLAEYRAGTDPRAYDTDGDGLSDYDSRPPIGGRTWGELFTDNDGIDDEWEALYPTVLSPLRYDATADPDGDGWSNLGEFLYRVNATNGTTSSTNPSLPASRPAPRAEFTFYYDGTQNAGDVVVLTYNTNTMDGPVRATITHAHAGGVFPFSAAVTVGVQNGYMREGPTWMFGFIDNNDNGEWDPGEPAGTLDGQPVNVGYGDVRGLVMRFTDAALPGLPRVSWEGVAGIVGGNYTVKVFRTSTVGHPLIGTMIVRNRDFLHEGDFFARGIAALDPGASDQPTYRFSVNEVVLPVATDYVVNWSTTPGTPSLEAPLGAVQFARNNMSWSASGLISQFRIEIRQTSTGGPVILDRVVQVPYASVAGRYVLDMADLALFAGSSSLPNGAYYWRVQALNPRRVSAFSSWGSFIVNVQDVPDAVHSAAGTSAYYGLASATGVVVEAYQSYGFGGKPEARTRTTAPGPFSLRGLRPGVYFIKAYMDLDGDGVQDWFEPSGFVKDYAYSGDYSPYGLWLPPNRTGLQLILRDHDANGNRIPDGWDYATSMNATIATFDTNGDGLPDGQAITMGLDPWRLDTDGDGAYDALELVVGTSPTSAGSTPTITYLFQVTGLVPGVLSTDVIYNFPPAIALSNYKVTAYVEAAPAPGKPYVELAGSRINIPVGSGFGTGPYTFTHVHGGVGTYFYRVRWVLTWPQ